MWWDYIFGWNECGLFWLKKNTIWCNPENFASVQTWQSNLDWLDESAKWASDHHCSGLQCKIIKLAQSQINKVGPIIINEMKLQDWSELVWFSSLPFSSVEMSPLQRGSSSCLSGVKAWTQSMSMASWYQNMPSRILLICQIKSETSIAQAAVRWSEPIKSKCQARLIDAIKLVQSQTIKVGPISK